MIPVTIHAVVNSAVELYTWVIFAWVIMSWLPMSPALGQVREFLDSVCEPYVGLFRRIIPMVGAGGVGLDLSPFIAILVLQLLRPLFVGLLIQAGL
jgi:YggT family protein